MTTLEDDKKRILSNCMFLCAYLCETTEIIDELEGTHLYKHSLKMAANKLQREIDKVFSTKEFSQFYSAEGGGDGLVKLTKLIEEVRLEFVNEITK